MLIANAVRFSTGCCKKLPAVPASVHFRFLNVDVTAVPAFPDLHDYPYETPISRRITQLRRDVQFRCREIEIRTCGTLFKKWKAEKRYWPLPDGDVPFTVRYLDTGLDVGKGRKPVVVILHGSPGSYDNFTEMTTYLHRHGVRVIAPCLPGISSIRMGRFRHTPEEKSEFVKDFLQAIDAPKIDLLVCHSSSLFPGVLLCKQKLFPINSLALLNPTAYEYPRVLKPLNAIRFMSRTFELPVCSEITDVVGRMIVRTKRQLKGNNHLDHFLSAFTMTAAEVPKRAKDFEAVVSSGLPVLLAFSENDKLIGKRALYKMAEMMVEKSEIQKYDENGKLVEKGGTNPARKVLAFKEGTHFVFQKHADVISEEIRSFLIQHLEKR